MRVARTAACGTDVAGDLLRNVGRISHTSDMELALTNAHGASSTSVVVATSLLEHGFPVEKISRLAKAARSHPHPVYGAHKWWARRPGQSVRALLLAAAVPDTDEADFWRRFADPADRSLASARVADPFVGGGTSLVEAQRLGAAAYGVDVDPLAVLINEHELEHLDEQEYVAASSALLSYLGAKITTLYPRASGDCLPLHYFYLRRVTCPECDQQQLLYKSLILARDVGRVGAVVRDVKVSAFCPVCLTVHNLTADRKTVVCCSRRFSLELGTFVRGSLECSCGHRARNEQLRSGLEDRVLIAVEETRSDGRRVIRAPSSDEAAQRRPDLVRLRRDEAKLVLPREALSGDLKAHKPGIYGFDAMDELFSPRQRIVFGTAFGWLRDQAFSRRVKVALALALSNALSSNNVLCGYATDYGRLAPLFSVRDYSLPILSVELNPLHPSAGRGTIPAMLRRVANSKCATGTSYLRDASVQVADSASFVWPDTDGFDIVMTDPPYFDYIAYSDLSLFFRVWLGAAGIIEHTLTGRPLYSGAASRDDFASRLGDSFAQATRKLKPGGVLVFTYHATTQRGWQAVASAIKLAGLALSAAFPVWADGKSPGHGHNGNVEYDIVLCCRAKSNCAWTRVSSETWLALFPTTSIGVADQDAWSVASAELNNYATGEA